MPGPLQLDRRTLLKTLALSAGAATALACAPFTFGESAFVGKPLLPWQEGYFDIHQIDTGRGNSALLIFPDGSTLMVDAGTVIDAAPGTTNPARPNDSLRPGQWQAHYALAHAPSKHLDYFLATHIHPDHVGGLADLDAMLPITTCIDRGFPHYAQNQLPSTAPFAQAYLALLRARVQQGSIVQAANVGSTTQIALKNTPGRYPSFRARILSANGNVWNRSTEKVDDLLRTLPAPAVIGQNENILSSATRFEYGNFSYYTGGDLTFDTQDGRRPELDIETPVARSAGRTEVAVANHHGYFDACGPNFTSTLDAQAYIISSWDIGHPGSAQMQRMLGDWNNQATHDVFATELLASNALLNRRFTPLLKSTLGHIVVRVAPGGGSYNIFILDSTRENGNVTGVFGPYQSRA
jgi:hypothetical protein